LDLEPTRALLIDLSRHFGGASKRALALLGGLSGEQGALAVLQGSPISRLAADHQYDCHVIARHKLDVRIPKKLGHLIQRHRFQVIDTQNPQSQLWGCLAAARSGVALVSTLNSWYFDEHGGNWKGRLYQTLQQITNPGVDLFIAVSGEIRERLLSSGIDEERIALIPNAVTLEPSSIARDRPTLCREFDFPPDAQVCCAVGRLVEAKGYANLLAAMARIAESHPRSRCLIIGDGGLYQTLARRIRQLGLQQRVRLTGFQPPDRTASLLKSSDLFVMPSISEGTPVALLEAAALGKPIAASRAGGIGSIVRHDEHALLVAPGDEAALAGALATLFDHPDLAHRLGSTAQTHVLSHFGLASQVETTRKAYQRARCHAERRRTSRNRR